MRGINAPFLLCQSTILLSSVLFAISPHPAGAAIILYSGSLFTDSGTPVVGGYVIAGTFRAGFDPYNGGEYGGTRYNCVYGDESCNLISGAYDMAVSDGNFIPFGDGAITTINGEFTAIGATSAAAGTPIWLFAFSDTSRNSSYQVLASSSDSTWRVPESIGSFVASDADLFVMGSSHPQGVSLRVVPIPEPSSLTMLVLVSCFAIGSRRRRSGAFTGCVGGGTTRKTRSQVPKCPGPIAF
ncbi:MAG: PEP-CTERM sorting domain-containing protein [Pirellulales bacterium]